MDVEGSAVFSLVLYDELESIVDAGDTNFETISFVWSN